MKIHRSLFLLAASCFCLASLPSRARQALHVDTSGNPLGPLNLASPNATGIAKLPPASNIGADWVFSTFDGSQQLVMAYSQDGVNWSVTGDLYAAPNDPTHGSVVRDSSITCINGVYYVAYTAAGISDDTAAFVGICTSVDLVNWTWLCNVSTSYGTPCQYSWAPEWFVDRDGTVYLYLCRLVEGAWHIFYTTPANLTLTAWNAVQEVGGQMPSVQGIDPQVVRDGDTYYLLYRDYNAPGCTNCIYMAMGTSPTAFNVYKTGDWAGWGTPREGPNLIHLGGSRWRIYMVEVGLPAPNVFYSDSLDNMQTWSALTATAIPGHGTILPLNAVSIGSRNVPSSPTLKSVILPPSTLTYSATQTIDFAGPGNETLALTGGVTFASANLAPGESISILLTAAATQTLAFPGGWVFLGQTAPTSLAAGKSAILSLTSFGTTDAQVIAAYSAQP